MPASNSPAILTAVGFGGATAVKVADQVREPTNILDFVVYSFSVSAQPVVVTFGNAIYLVMAAATLTGVLWGFVRKKPKNAA